MSWATSLAIIFDEMRRGGYNKRGVGCFWQTMLWGAMLAKWGVSRLLVALLLAVTVEPGAAAWAAEGKRVALVVGVGAYQNAPVLANPPNDARAVGDRLKGLGFDVDAVIDPDRSTLEQAVKRFGDRLQNATVGLFFYAGHGLQVAGRNYLVPIDARIDNERSLPFATIDIDLVLSQMGAAAPVNLVFLDACRDNPFSRSLARSLGTRSASVGRGLAQVEAGDGTLIVYATQPGNVAEDGEGGDSPFTTALLKHLAEPNLEVRQALTRVRLDVKEATNGKQVPWDHSSLTQDFYFVGPTTVTVTPSPAPAGVDPMAVELAFWDSIRSSTDRADFEEYLKQYPQGKFSGIAKRRLAALRNPETLPSAAHREPTTPPAERHSAEHPPQKTAPEPKVTRAEPPAEEPPPQARPTAPQVPANFDSVYRGTVTNLTVGQSALMQFEMRKVGTQLEAFVRVGPPLLATGPLVGTVQNGTCRLRGVMYQGFILEAAGKCSITAFDGRYRGIANGQVQEGVFDLRSVNH